MRRRVSTVCSLCVHECGIEVEVENGRPVRVRGLREHGGKHTSRVAWA